jgi:hypothetical protein
MLYLSILLTLDFRGMAVLAPYPAVSFGIKNKTNHAPQILLYVMKDIIHYIFGNIIIHYIHV